MFALSTLELILVALWAMGILVAVALLMTRDLTLRARLIILIAALALPVAGSIAVIFYAVLSTLTRFKNARKVGTEPRE